MLNVGQINNISFKSNSSVSFAADTERNFARKIYMDTNKDVFNSYTSGDISLLKYLSNKLKDYWNIVTNSDPDLDMRAKLIEKQLKLIAERKQYLDLNA